MRRTRYLIACIVLTSGLFFLLYPLVENWLGEKAASEKIESYHALVEETEPSDFERMKEEVRAYNEALAGEGVSEAKYEELLALTDSLGYLEVPKIGIYLPIYRGITEEVLQKGIGHMTETSLPGGGSSTHCVLSGHTGLPAAKLFTDLDQMEMGDRFYLHILDQVLAYEVNQIKVVLPEETEDIQIQAGKDYVTLLTCTPFGINSHRLLVRGERIPYEEKTVGIQLRAEPDTKAELPLQKLLWYAGIVAAAVFQQISFWLFILSRKKKKC